MSTFFLVCLLVGLGLSAVSFIAGFDGATKLHLFHHHHGGLHIHHGPHVHHGAAHHGGAHDAGGKNIVHPTPESAPNVPVINMMAIMAFLMWFGGAGTLLVHQTSLPMALITGTSVVSGAIGGFLINRFLRVFVRDE